MAQSITDRPPGFSVVFDFSAMLSLPASSPAASCALESSNLLAKSALRPPSDDADSSVDPTRHYHAAT